MISAERARQSIDAQISQRLRSLYAQASGHMISYSERASRAGGNDLCTGIFQVRDELLALLRLLDAREDHLRALDVLLRRQQIVEERVLAPNNARVFIGVREGVARGLAGLPPEDAVEVRPLLVRASTFHGVALRALRLKNFGSFGGHFGLRKIEVTRRRRGGGVDGCRCCGARSQRRKPAAAVWALAM